MCLSIYLVHYLNVLFSFVNMQEPYQFGVAWLAKILLIDILVSLVCSFLFYMLIESPFVNLTKLGQLKLAR
jgi:peptidoglycan/LPS O-acetylase OafA/YrhL